ncbi:MAG: type II toxin-antitoxin system VapC family toxin [Verrucomicrobia bacterium]|nr:type II toxin-antitoxin system VapC family toxin [Verrucomicrobiota bacterium]
MYLLDTCVFSELIKKEASLSVIEWVLGKDDNLFSVCSLTFGEIRKGIEKMAESARKKKLEAWYQEFLIPRFWHRIVPIDGQVAGVWGELIAKAEKKGRVLPTIDSLIAAACITHNLHLVTRNIKDFQGLDLTIVNPWVQPH